MIRWGVFCLGLFAMIAVAMAQVTDELPTNNTKRKRVEHRKYEPKRKVYDKLYTKNTKGTLYGNPCALAETRRMGFEYVPLAQGRGKSKVGLILNNTFVHTRLIFTRSPFWKIILNKRLKDCRLKSGDGVG